MDSFTFYKLFKGLFQVFSKYLQERDLIVVDLPILLSLTNKQLRSSSFY